MHRAPATAAARCSSQPCSSALWVVAPEFGDGLTSCLADSLGKRARWLPALPTPDAEAPPPARLLVGVHRHDDGAARSTLAAWSHATGVPALAVTLGPGAALLGPLTVPGRVGCGHCAGHRMVAAAAARRRPESATGVEEGYREAATAAGPELTREVDRILRGGCAASDLLDHVRAVDPASGLSSLHRVIPLSRCPVCGGAATLKPTAPEARGLSPDDSAETVLGALAGWVDPLTGVIPDLMMDRRADPDSGIPIVVTAAPPHVVGQDGSPRRLPLGWGKGSTLSGAILSAVGEAIERYAPSLPDPERIVWERPEALAGDRLDPREFALYGEEQYARDGFVYPRFDPAGRHPWVRGRWLGSGKPVWVPAVLAFLSLEVGREHLFCQGSSNGLAASIDLDDAALRATLELVERDAFLGAWWSGRAGLRVDLDAALDPASRRVVEAIEALGGAVELYLLPTSACGATALCLALGDGERWPGVALGLGADLDPRRALGQAVYELAQTGPHLRSMMRSGTLPTPADAGAVREMLDHAAYYFPPERKAAFDRLRAGRADQLLSPSALGGGQGERSLATCATALTAAGVRVALVDVTSPDVATGPFRVVRAVSPDLQPISFGHGLDRQPVPRLLARGPAADVPPIHPIW